MRIPLGTIVIDKVTGLKGVAENRSTYLYGCDRYYVQPRAKDDGTVPDGLMIDEPQLEVAQGEKSVMQPPIEPPQKIKLGSVVNDPIRGMQGTATGRAVYLNGCSRILVEPQQNGNEERKSWWVDEDQLTLKKSLFGSKVKAVNTEGTNQKSGGPARSCSKY